MAKNLRFTLMSMLLLVCGSTWADKVVTFTAGVDKTEETTLTKDGVTLTVEKGTSTSGAGKLGTAQYRFYKGNDLTVSSTEGNITQIVFTCTASGTEQHGPGGFAELDGYTYDGNIGTWTGSAESVKFTAEKNQVRATSVEVTVSDGTGQTKQDAGLAFSETTVNHETGTAFTAPTFTKATTAPVTFVSDNESVAAVNSEGVISLGGEEGKAVITASAEANDEYKAGTATCTVYVWHYNCYRKASAIESGKQYLIVAQRDDNTYYATNLSKSAKYGYLSTQNVEGYVDEIKVKSSYSDAYTFETCGNGYSIKDSYGRYLYMDDSHASFQLGEEAKEWTAEANADGTFKLTNNGKYIQWGDGTYTTFGAYAEARENTVMPMLYVFDAAATGLNTVHTATAANDGAAYNAAGQRVGKDYRGLVIVNGKKVVRK